MDRIRMGVIGLGWFGEIHCDAIASVPNLELVALCTRRPDRGETSEHVSFVPEAEVASSDQRKRRAMSGLSQTADVGRVGAPTRPAVVYAAQSITASIKV